VATVIADMSMSLDGFVADEDDGVDLLFTWYRTGDVVVPTANADLTFRTSDASAAELRKAMTEVGVLVCGRRLFDLAGGWGGRHPVDVPVVVVSHHVPDGWIDGESFAFVTSGIDDALARATEIAGDKVVGIATATIAQQCLNAGLLDRLRINLVPVLLGRGVPFFEHLAARTALEGPRVTEGHGVTHLEYGVRSSVPAPTLGATTSRKN